MLSCEDKKNGGNEITTPWGDTLDTSGNLTGDTSNTFTVSDLIRNGEIIMLTESGPKTYYEYRGCYLGTQYLLINTLAEKLGVRVRVDVCKDSIDILKRLENNEGDIGAFNTVGSFKASNDDLQKMLKKLVTMTLINQVMKNEAKIVSGGGVKRKVYDMFRDPEGGVICDYDGFFKKYSKQTDWDWRLLAAQCYQESCFDPKAESFAGAKGLMQIMPKTAEHLGLAEADIFNPEKSIAAACKYIVELTDAFKDVPDSYERQNFVLAAYNGGSGHVRDAMAMAKADGKNQYFWDDVKVYVLKLSSPEHYHNPIVKHGYMRGHETVGYVDNIRRRYATYGGVNKLSGRTYEPVGNAPSNIDEFTPTAIPERGNVKKK